MNKPGPLIILSGPSGSGKTTVVNRLLATTPLSLRRAITATTRPMRSGELDGIDYHFWTREEFERHLARQDMLEYAIVHGTHYYGTPRQEVDPYREQGIGVILVIDVQGARQVREVVSDTKSFFLFAPEDQLITRMKNRGEMSPEELEARLVSARLEIHAASQYDEQLVNDDLDQTVRTLELLLKPLFAPHRGGLNVG
jgi:guanylate kinase